MHVTICIMQYVVKICNVIYASTFLKSKIKIGKTFFNRIKSGFGFPRNGYFDNVFIANFSLNP